MVLGGKVDDQNSASVLVYDPEEDAWATAAPLPRPEIFSPDLAAARLQMNADGEIIIACTAPVGCFAVTATLPSG